MLPLRRVISAGVVLIVGSSACGDATTAAGASTAQGKMVATSNLTQSAIVMQLVASAPTVRVLDRDGRPIAGVDVLFSASAGDASVVATSADGTVSRAWRLGPVAGAQSMLVSIPRSSVPGVMFTATALADTATVLNAISARLQPAFPSLPVPLPPSVVVADRYGNPKAGIDVTFEVGDGSGTVAPPTVTTNANGVATVQRWTLGPDSTENTLTVHALHLTPVTFTARINSPLFGSLVVAGSQHTCAIAVSGSTYCWGANDAAQINASVDHWISLPTLIKSAPAFVALASGSAHTCGISHETPPKAYCWGGNAFGPPPAGGAPVQVPVEGGLAMVTAGAGHDCGLTPAGDVYCWGDGTWGQLGDGGTGGHALPLPVAGDVRFTSLAAGTQHTCGLAVDGQLFCWGLGDHGQLGFTPSPTCVIFDYYYASVAIPCALAPVSPPTVQRFVAIAAGYGTCGLTALGEVYCSGFGSTMLTSVSQGVRFAQLAPGGNCGLTADGAAYCWAEGTLAHAVLIGALRPVGNGLAFKSITAGFGHQCGVLAKDGAVMCWGNNDVGQLGNGTTAFGAVPLPVFNPITP